MNEFPTTIIKNHHRRSNQVELSLYVKYETKLVMVSYFGVLLNNISIHIFLQFFCN